MRIFYASDTTPNAFFESNLWRKNLYEPLVDMGYEVVEFQYDFGETFKKVDTSNRADLAFIRVNRPKVSEAVLQQVKAVHSEKPIDLFFSYFYDACILPEAIDEVKAMGIKTVNFFCNASYQIHLVKEISPHYDWCLVAEHFRLEDYRAMGANPIYCQMAANPIFYKPVNLPYQHDVTFVGAPYGERPHYIKYLLDHGIDVQAWGYGWHRQTTELALCDADDDPSLKKTWNQLCRRLVDKNPQLLGYHRKPLKFLYHALHAGLFSQEDTCNIVQGPIFDPSSQVYFPKHVVHGLLSDVEMVQLYSLSKINLGFSSCGQTHLTGNRILQVRLRDFEVPMSGGFYMVEYMPELEMFYDIGKEVVCYEGPDDLVDKVRYYLAHDEERERIRQAGYERCRRDHTWQNRFRAAFREMGLIQETEEAIVG